MERIIHLGVVIDGPQDSIDALNRILDDDNARLALMDALRTTIRKKLQKTEGLKGKFFEMGVGVQRK